jgi:hypothetical protein
VRVTQVPFSDNPFKGILCLCAHSTSLIRLNDRQAIARAVYAQADIILLDDVFSALDGETEAHGKKTDTQL